MSILKKVSKYSTILLPICSVVGFFFPSVANALLPYLPKILFFLMFFTLLGVDQRTLFKKLFSLDIFQFSIFQNIIICVAVTTLAYLAGIRDDLLLAIAALGATSPLFASGAIVNAMGFDALQALAKTIIATLLMPFTLFIVLLLMASDNATLDIVAYLQRLVIYIICPILLSVTVKYFTPKKTLDKYYPKVAEFNILLVLSFPLGLSGGFRETFNKDASHAMMLFALANMFAFVVFALTYLAYVRTGKQRAIIASTVSTGRNMVLTFTIAQPFIGTMFLPLVGAVSLSMYALPLIAKTMITKVNKQA